MKNSIRNIRKTTNEYINYDKAKDLLGVKFPLLTN